MTTQRTGLIFSDVGGWRMAVAAIAVIGLAGCASATIEDAVPVSAAEAQPAPAFSEPGEYPNLNVIPTPAAAQFTPEERRAETAMLQSIREQQSRTAASQRVENETTELRRLARRHAKQALDEIESQ